MTGIKPHLVINNLEKEKELENITLASCGNNVCTLLTQIQEKKDEIDTLRKDSVDFDEQIFKPSCLATSPPMNTTTFEQSRSSRVIPG